MINPKSLANLRPIQPGHTSNPGGKPVNARNALKNQFLKRLAADFDKDGKQAIINMREKDPSGYIKAIVALMPKELEISRPLDELSDEQLNAALIAARAILAAQNIGSGAGPESQAEPTEELSSLPEAD